MIEFSIGHEYGRMGSVLFLTHVQQFDSPMLSGEALEGELDIGETLEFNLKPGTFLHPRPKLPYLAP